MKGTCHSERIGWDKSFKKGPPITTPPQPNFEARQLVLFGAAAVVLLVFVWTLVH
jgi:hypothetical protein